jgi:hypothetical protein
MPDYPRLNELAAGLVAGPDGEPAEAAIASYLVSIWAADYTKHASDNTLVETRVSGFSYLFDVYEGRLVAAWGVSQGRHAGARDKARMAGHPLGGDKRYHRGHAIPHSLGGPTDINLVPQLGAVNIGSFRVLERKAVATPGSFYFTYWIYRDSDSQRPVAVQQGLVCPGLPPDVRKHCN